MKNLNDGVAIRVRRAPLPREFPRQLLFILPILPILPSCLAVAVVDRDVRVVVSPSYIVFIPPPNKLKNRMGGLRGLGG